MNSPNVLHSNYWCRGTVWKIFRQVNKVLTLQPSSYLQNSQIALRKEPIHPNRGYLTHHISQGYKGCVSQGLPQESHHPTLCKIKFVSGFLHKYIPRKVLFLGNCKFHRGMNYFIPKFLDTWMSKPCENLNQRYSSKKQNIVGMQNRPRNQR